MPASPATASPATRIMVSIQNAGLGGGCWGACQAHAANHASLPSLSRAPWSPLDQHRLWLTTGDRVTRLKNFRLKLITTCIRMITGSRSALFVRVR